MESNRKPTLQEERLINFLVEISSINLSQQWKENLLVRPMQDGEMGSLYLFTQESITENRLFGKRVSEYQFTDEDGVIVIASLNVDDKGNLFELDIWKTDFSPLIKMPTLP